jgi:chromosome segregation ATPase
MSDNEADKPLKKGDDFDNELEANASAFEALERDFQDVLTELMGDHSLERFRLEYEKLHRALKKSHEQEKRLVKKCRELNAEMLNNQAKIKTALRLSQEDQKNIAHLQKEMEKTWKLVHMAQEKETRAKETITQLKEEMANLSKLVERGAGLSVNQENMMKEFKQAKEELQMQVDDLMTQTKQMEIQLIEQSKVQDALREDRDKLNGVIEEMKAKVTGKENEVLREQRRREKVQKELQDARQLLDEKIIREDQMSGEVRKTNFQVQELEKQLTDARVTMEKYLRDYDVLFHRTTKVTEDLEEQVQRNRQIFVTNQNLDKEMKKKNAEIARLTTDKGTLERVVDREHRQVLEYKQQLEDSKTPVLVLQAEVESLQRELLILQRREDELLRQKDSIEREKIMQVKATGRAESRTKENEDLLREQERVSSSLSHEVDGYKIEIQKLRKVIYSLEKDRERLGNEVIEHRNNHVSAVEELKLRDISITELRKKINDSEVKLSQQQHLYESVRSDRNHYSKNLIEAQDEIAEMRKKFKIMDHQIEQLREEVRAKDQAIVKEHFDYQRAEKMREHTNTELSRKNMLLRENEDLIHKQDSEIRQLATTIRKMDEDALAQRKEYDQVINERDILGTQLIRRNDELALLYEKLRVQQSALRAGEVQYTARLDDIKALRLKLKDISRELNTTKGSNAIIERFRRDVLHLQRELLQERTKVTALSEELENPMNIHRWRKLEGSDPATFELIQKIQTLQRRLISKTEEAIEKGVIIQEKEKLYNELKAVLARQPGPEVAEQLTTYQQGLKQKTRQMKSMASELNMYQAQVNEYRFEVERLTRELQDLKRKYYQKKRKDLMMKDALSLSVSQRKGGDSDEDGGGGIEDKRIVNRTAPAQMLRQEQTAAAEKARIKFTGGGFAVK